MGIRKLVRNLRMNAELYRELEKQINILSGMALLARDFETLRRTNERMDDILKRLRASLGIEE